MKIIYTVTFTLLSLILLGQQGVEDVIHLINGDILYGEVTDIIIGKQITLITSDGKVRILTVKEVDRITKEEVFFSRNKNNFDPSKPLGYITSSISKSIPYGEYKESEDVEGLLVLSGTHYDILRVGYHIQEDISINIGYYKGKNPWSNEFSLDDDTGWEYQGIAIGAIYHHSLINNVNLEIGLNIGYNKTVFPDLSTSAFNFEVNTPTAISYNYSLGTSVDLTKNIGIRIYGSIFQSNADFEINFNNFSPDLNIQIRNYLLGAGLFLYI